MPQTDLIVSYLENISQDVRDLDSKVMSHFRDIKTDCEKLDDRIQELEKIRAVKKGQWKIILGGISFFTLVIQTGLEYFHH